MRCHHIFLRHKIIVIAAHNELMQSSQRMTSLKPVKSLSSDRCIYTIQYNTIQLWFDSVFLTMFRSVYWYILKLGNH